MKNKLLAHAVALRSSAVNTLQVHLKRNIGKRARAVIEELKSKGITVFGATGYCYGGARLVFDLAFENIIRVAVITHPSLLTTEDLDIYVEKSKAPLLLNSCEHDELFPPALALTTDEKFSNFEPGSAHAGRGFTMDSLLAAT